MNTITKAMSLMNFQDSYLVSARGQLFQNELDWVLLKTGTHPSDALFISYAFKGDNYPAYFLSVSDIFAKAGIKLTDITSGDPAGLIAASKLIVTGGGDIATFMTKMNSLITPAFNPFTAIKNKVEGGVPYLGWNEGSVIISPKYFAPPSNALLPGINVSPYQIACHYQNSSQNKTAIFDFLITNPLIKKVIGQVDQLKHDGTSVRLEETGAGMIDSATAPFPIVIRFKIVNGILVEN